MNKLLSKKNIVVSISIGVCCIASILLTESLSVFLKHQMVEEILGAPLPKSVTDLHYYRYQVGSGPDEFYTYIKFGATKEEYLNMMSNMSVSTYINSFPQLRLLLPGKWVLPTGVRLAWWNPTMDIPNDTAIQYLGSNFVVAKHENGYVYIVIHKQVLGTFTP